jgi:hypothetical protein
MTIYKTFDLYQPKECSALKVDLDHNYEHYRKEVKQTVEFRRWATSLDLKIDRNAFESKMLNHPHKEAINLLLDLNMFRHFFNSKDIKVFKHIWIQIYQHEMPMSKYHKRKLDQIALSAEYTKNKLHKVRYEKGDHDMRTKGSPATEFI